MIVNFEHLTRIENKILTRGEGHCDINEPVIIYGKFPIEKEQFEKLQNACREYKISIYDLILNTLNQEPDNIDFLSLI